MKYLFTVLSIFVLAYTANAQKFDWEWQNPKLHGNIINDVVPLTSSKLIAVGEVGSLLISNDGGQTWSYKQLDTTASDFKSVFFVNSSTGYICGDNGLIYKTVDGGLTWTILQSGTTEDLSDIEFLDANTGLAVGANGTIIKTTDAGANWAIQSSPTTGAIYSLKIISTSKLIIGTTSSSSLPILNLSTDFGATWQNVTPSAFTYSIYSIQLADANTLYAISTTGRVLKSTDAGATFAAVTSAGSSSLYGAYFKSADNGYVASSDGNIYTTTDGGTSWNSAKTGTPGLRNITVSSLGLVAVGDFGSQIVSTDNGLTWDLKFSAVTQDPLKKMVFLDENTGFACGGVTTVADSMGFILKTTNGGDTWAKVSYFETQLTGIAVPSASVWYATTNNNKLFKTTDAGQTWSEQTNPITGSSAKFFDMTFYDENIGYAAGTSGKIIKTTDGGATWTALTSPFGTSTIYEIQALDAQTAVAVGLAAKAFKTTDGGATWTALATQIPGNFFGMKFKGNLGLISGYVSGSSASFNLSLTTDAGATWTALNSPSNMTTSIWAVAIKDSSSFWIGDGNGNIAYTNDAGNTWTTARTPTGNLIYTIEIQGSKLWISGNGGNIIKGYSDSTVPVELTSFAASVKNNKVVVAWQTATETNNKGFNLERKASGSDWKNIAFVAGKGTSSEASSYVYEDAAAAGKVYYRLKQIDYDGTYKYSDAIEVDVTAPAKFELSQNYPNPFNPTTTIKYSVPQKENVTLKVFNVLGKEVAVLVNSVQEAGSYNAKFDASSLSSGVYFYELSAGVNRSFKKMILIK